MREWQACTQQDWGKDCHRQCSSVNQQLDVQMVADSWNRSMVPSNWRDRGMFVLVEAGDDDSEREGGKGRILKERLGEKTGRGRGGKKRKWGRRREWERERERAYKLLGQTNDSKLYIHFLTYSSWDCVDVWDTITVSHRFVWPGGTIWSWISHKHEDDIEQVVHQYCHSYFINPWMLGLCTCMCNDMVSLKFTVYFTFKHVQLQAHYWESTNIYTNVFKQTAIKRPVYVVQWLAMQVASTCMIPFYYKESIRVTKEVGTDGYAFHIQALSHKR